VTSQSPRDSLSLSLEYRWSNELILLDPLTDLASKSNCPSRALEQKIHWACNYEVVVYFNFESVSFGDCFNS
jgi:hypothetical protein